jgi:hypothetical protein
MTIKQQIAGLLFFSLALVWNPGTQAADTGASAIQQMATIMHRLKHFPSPQGKETLRAIVANNATTANERTLAMAMLNLEHMAIPEDKPKLQAIIDSGDATANEKGLARIILNLNHRPTANDKKMLKGMMQ